MSPVGLSCLLLISILVCNWAPVDCYANGKVTKSCDNMEPRHGFPGESTPSPYQLVTNTTTFRPKDHIRGNLSVKREVKLDYTLRLWAKKLHVCLNWMHRRMGLNAKTKQQHTEVILEYFVYTNSFCFLKKIFAVVLSGKSYFKGFLLEARDAGNQHSVSTVGTFTLISPDKTQLLTCGKHKVYIPTHRHRLRI